MEAAFSLAVFSLFSLFFLIANITTYMNAEDPAAMPSYDADVILRSKKIESHVQSSFLVGLRGMVLF